MMVVSYQRVKDFWMSLKEFDISNCFASPLGAAIACLPLVAHQLSHPLDMEN